MKTFASLARRVAVAATVAAVASLVSPASWAGGGGHGGGWHGGRGGWHGGSGHVHGGYYGHYGHGYWPAFWGVGVGVGIGYYGAYYGGYYAPYYGPYYGGYYDPQVVVVPSGESHGAASSGQPVPQSSAAAEPIFYPRNGQSAETTESDRRDCNRWATTQRGAMSEASIFQRATLACMEGRGYTVK
jgi:hypothetical protein